MLLISPRTPGGGEVPHKSFHPGPAAPLAGPAVVAVVEPQYEVVSVCRQQRRVVPSVQLLDLPGELEPERAGKQQVGAHPAGGTHRPPLPSGFSPLASRCMVT